MAQSLVEITIEHNLYNLKNSILKYTSNKHHYVLDVCIHI